MVGRRVAGLERPVLLCRTLYVQSAPQPMSSSGLPTWVNLVPLGHAQTHVSVANLNPGGSTANINHHNARRC